MQWTSEIVVAYLAHKSIEPDALPRLVREVRAALEGTDAAGSTAEVTEASSVIGDEPRPVGEVSAASEDFELRPAVPIDRSITPDYLLSLEDGRPYRSLKRHLMARHGLTP
ncbi:MAG: MucR family transcriptional regulator, partial [Methylobacterium sp.]|nr:MucR family transcriptional regulator [Methylobacterium sp.]